MQGKKNPAWKSIPGGDRDERHGKTLSGWNKIFNREGAQSCTDWTVKADFFEGVGSEEQCMSGVSTTEATKKMVKNYAAFTTIRSVFSSDERCTVPEPGSTFMTVSLTV
jgi:hypothetical protein